MNTAATCGARGAGRSCRSPARAGRESGRRCPSAGLWRWWCSAWSWGLSFAAGMAMRGRWVNCRRMLCGEIGDNPEIFIANTATMNRLDAMTLFVRVADLGSFAAAANHPGVARSVVTRQIAALEEHLGVKLIVRTTRKLTLTSAGADYLDKCRTILDLVESA